MKHYLFTILLSIAVSTMAPTLNAAETPANIVIDVDPEDVTYFAGTGSNTVTIMTRWNDSERLNNLICGYHYDNESTTPIDILKGFAEADERFNITLDESGTSVISASFDLDGSGDITAYDNSRTNDENNTWQIIEATANDEESPVIILDYTNQSTGFVAPDYLFMLPMPTAVGVWVPESMTVRIADDAAIIPSLIQPDVKGTKISTASSYWRISSDGTDYVKDNTIISGVTLVSDAYSAKVKYVGSTTGSTYVQFRPRYSSAYQPSNFCKVTVLEPEIPITSIKWENEAVVSGLNQQVFNKMTYEPANATYTAVTLTSSDTKIATITSDTIVKTTKVAGSAVISATSKWNPQGTTSYTLESKLVNPITKIDFDGLDENGEIHINPKEMLGLIPVITPADADITDNITYTLTGAGETSDEIIASMYKVNYWDENNTRIQFYELSGHRVGSCTLTVAAGDGAGYERTINIIVEDPDRTPLENGYVDGTIILNEEWYGHTNGGLNYLTPDYEYIYQAYERENPGMSFGCTSQYGIIWAGKLIVCSKQAADGGDPLPGGGRLVVADAKTLKRIGSFDDLMYGDETKSSDSRAVVGATPSKIYVGSTSGVYIVDLDSVKVIGKISGLSSANSLYSGQIGDMVNAGRYVFGIKQSTGVFIIDTETDSIAKQIEDTGVQGITQTADGSVWYATTVNSQSNFVCLNPATLEETSRVVVPSEVGTVSCMWGAWTSTSFYGSKKENDLWFVGSGSSLFTSSGNYFRYHVGDDIAQLTPVFSLSDMAGTQPNVTQKTYGTMRYDDRTNLIYVMTTENKASGHYRNNWTHLVNGTTGEIEKSIYLRPYYWFQALPIFPDKYAPEINIDENISLSLDGDNGEYDLNELITDQDNISYNIIASVVADDSETPVAEITLSDKVLTIAPKSVGNTKMTLTAQSNGVEATKDVTITVSKTSGIDNINTSNGSIKAVDNRIIISGYNGVSFNIYSLNATLIGSFTVDSDKYIAQFDIQPGMYIVRGDNGVTSKVLIK